MLRSLLQVVLLPDRARIFGQWRFRRFGQAAVLGYGLLIAVGASAEYVQHQDPDGWWPLLFAIVLGSFALTLFSVLAAWRLATAGLLLTRLVFDAEPGVLGSWEWFWYLPVMLVVGLCCSGRVIGWVALITTATVYLLATTRDLDYALPTTGLVLLMLVLGYAFGSRGRAERRFHEERDEKAVLVERARIAREMHDVVAHHMSMVVVRCETAPYRISGLPEAGLREFAELGAAARAAITDMQGLLGVLRADDQRPDHAPQPGLADIRVLAPQASVADVEVPSAVGLTAYRVVQEALTNATRHAPGSAVSVVVSAVDGAVEVFVRNTAGGPSTGGGGGHGLVGMRERVAVHGGTVTASSTEDGGFAVRARIPLGER
ncbi:histidine kinase [Actinosynnema sp. NPDC047251]|uniref:histidine kinase n=1 Tax=Saccharothrix espanaensis (strain ATCC 51144 / DSM 44229 / JCM 9112 / NBRC 15066 / NRRL 15764) TaxID=1179773 RepID=K0K8M4_SACES|nr:histidine kinase [Saccharothrix espanaensis]CCH34731.1 putative histidine kinase [Saccharothrix espanaensis DSM 44229]